MVESKTIGSRIARTLIYSLVGLLGITCLLPLINTLAMSLSSSNMAASGNVYFWPKQFTFAAYETILRESQFFVSFGISVQRVLLGGALNTLLTVLAAYPLSKSPREFRGRNVYMWIMVFTMIFSGGLIPWYLVISKLKLLDSIWALILPGAVPVYNCILLMNYFRGLPKELDEAAVIDGTDPIRSLLFVFLPISVPCLATVTLFALVGHWNEFFNGMILMNTVENYPLATYISQMVKAERDMLNITDTEELIRLAKVSTRTVNSAKTFVAMIPILLVYPLLQRYFVTGIVMGSVKE